MKQTIISKEIFFKTITAFWNKVKDYVDSKILQGSSSRKIEVATVLPTKTTIDNKLVDYIKAGLFDCQITFPYNDIVLTPSNMYITWRDLSEPDVAAIYCNVSQGNVSVRIEVTVLCYGKIEGHKSIATVSFELSKDKYDRKWYSAENVHHSLLAPLD